MAERILTMKHYRSLTLALVLLVSSSAHAKQFKAGFASQEITPSKATPMWGYGARHAALSTGVRDSLFVKVVVIDVESEKLAIVGLDLGRSPTDAMMARIRTSIKDTSNVGLVLISGSHTHHGPVIELLDEPGAFMFCKKELEKYNNKRRRHIPATYTTLEAHTCFTTLLMLHT